MIQIEDFVQAQLYENEEAVVQDALRHLLRSRPDLRIRLAIHRYQQEDLSLGKAAQLAGVSWAQMRDILMEQGIQPGLGPENELEAKLEIEQLRQHLSSE